MRKIFLSFTLMAVYFFPGAARGDAVIAGWPCIIDADTLSIGGRLVKGRCEGGIRVRIYGIDAPETKQVCKDPQGRDWRPARDAKKAAIAIVRGKNTMTCQHHFGKFAQGRPVVTCLIDGEDYGRALTRQGWALAYRKYSKDYVEEEQAARSAGRGIWAGKCAAPWDWRRRHKK